MKGGTLFRVLVLSGCLAVVAAGVAWVATAASNDPPLTPASFALSVGGTDIALFSELGGAVSGIDPSQLDLVEGTALRLPGKRTPPMVVLKRGTTRDTALWAWHLAALSGDPGSRKDADLVVYSADHTEIARYHLENAWPSKIEIGGLKAGSGEPLMETITIVHEGIRPDDL